MSLSGQLNDLSLGELIEFFCNQRKTGRLKVDYALAPGVFFIDGGELVDAKVGSLNGAEAIYFAMTLPSASFDFSAGMLSSRRTISERWPSVVLEGLRRIDEGLPAASADAFLGDDSLDEATLAYLNCVEESKGGPATAGPGADERAAKKIEEAFEQPAPFALTVEAVAGGGGRRKMMYAGVAGAIVIVCAVAAIPLSKRFSGKAASAAPAAATAEAAPAIATAPAPAEAETPAPAAEVSPTPDAAAEEAARREAREREARERARKQREEAARRADADAGGQTAGTTTAPAPKPAAPSGHKSVRVQISYDEAGRVTQASAVGTSPGAEAYASTAVRVARGRRFPAGKAGTTVVTIPIN